MDRDLHKMSREVFTTLLMTPAPAVPVTRILGTIPLASVGFRDPKNIPIIPLLRDYPAGFVVAGLVGGRQNPPMRPVPTQDSRYLPTWQGGLIEA